MQNSIAIIRADDRFTTLVRTLKAAGMIDTLGGSGPFTLFAPTNEAFSLLPIGLLDGLLQRGARDRLTRLMTCHAVAGTWQKADLHDGQTLLTIQGEPLRISLKNGRLLVNNVPIVTGMESANGYIYAIDAVLMSATAGDS